MSARSATALAGCWRLQLPQFADARGNFTKLLHAPTLEGAGLESHFVESYYSISQRGVIRGLHFQSPPHEHAKLVMCLSGRARDVVLDLRRGSPTYGQSAVFELEGGDGQAIYIPRGMAHGFAALAEQTGMLYYVSSVHAPANDCGLRWDAAGIDWGVEQPILSERDRGFGTLAEFDSPFAWNA